MSGGSRCPSVAWARVWRTVISGLVTIPATGNALIPFGHFSTSDPILFTTGAGSNPVPAPGDTILQVRRPGLIITRLHLTWAAGTLGHASSILHTDQTLTFGDPYTSPENNRPNITSNVGGLSNTDEQTREYATTTLEGISVSASNADVATHDVVSFELYVAWLPYAGAVKSVY